MPQPPWEKEWCDYYKLLQVRLDASTDVIEGAYKRLSRRHHPDVGGDPVVMRLLNDAHDVLRAPDSRRAYDAEFDRRRAARRRDRDEARRRERLRAEEAERRAREAEARAERAERQRAATEAARAREQAEQAEARQPAVAAPAAPGGAGEAPNFGRILGEVAGGLARAWLANRQAEREHVTAVDGLWQDADGNRYVLRQLGRRLDVHGTDAFGRSFMRGQGTVRGSVVEVRFMNANGTSGVAELRLVDGRSLVGVVTTLPMGMGAPVQLWRMSGGPR